jgi:probable F420-dependent oxidoreductase
VVRAFRFGVALGYELTGDPAAEAVRAESLGYDVVLLGDHIGPELSPMVALAAAAQQTERIRLGTLVINADLRLPTQLAWDAVTLDHLSGGRFELGIGAGHTPQEYGAVGMPRHQATVRKQRLMELVEIVRRLVDGETVEVTGGFFDLRGAHVGRSAQEHLPILVGGNGDRLLQHAGRHADIVGLQGLGRTLADGHRHEVLWSVEHLDRQIEQVRVGAGDRMDQVELSALVQVVDVTDHRSAALDRICAGTNGLDRAAAEVTPYVLVGSVEEIVAQLQEARRRWGISYFCVRDGDRFAPVLTAVHQAEASSAP